MRRQWIAVFSAACVVILAAGLILIVKAWRATAPGPIEATGPVPTASASPSSGPSPTPSPSASPSVSPSTSRTSTSSTPTARPPTTAPFPARFLGRDVTRIPTDQPIVALTFDAGTNDRGLRSMLDTLAQEDIRGTFFIEGDFVLHHPAAVADIVARGHRVGNHSATHPHFTQLTDAQIAAEVRGGESILRQHGADPRPLFRFPYGDRDARTIRAVNAVGYLPVGWTCDTNGYLGISGGMTVDRVVATAVAELRPGGIVLMHVGSNPTDGSTLDADALPTVIARFRARGYTFVTLDVLL